MTSFLGLDFGLKRIGLALAINNIVQPLGVFPNDTNFPAKLQRLIQEYKIEKIYVGLSYGPVATRTQEFIQQLNLGIPCEFVEEQVSSKEATEIYKANKNKKKNYKQTIDAVSAAVILQRVLL